MGIVFPYPYCEEFPPVIIKLENPLKTVNSVALQIARDDTTGDYAIFAIKSRSGRVRTRIADLTKQLEVLLSDVAMEIEYFAYKNNIPRAAFEEWMRSREANTTPDGGELWGAQVGPSGKLCNIRLVSENLPHGSILVTTLGPLRKGFRRLVRRP
jgi:hypothetical protein